MKTNAPVLGDAIPSRGNKLSQAIGRFLLAISGWRFEGNFPDVAKFVLIVAPHTSNWDFLLGMSAVFAINLKVSVMGKHTLFRWPFVGTLRWLGVVPTDRRAPGGLVAQTVTEFKNRRQFVLAIAPEGTRKKVKQWKTGFYHIAHGADVPIVPVGFDYGRKVVNIGPLFVPTGDITADLPAIQSFYDSIAGKKPHQF